ncbi:MAG: L,D-transpeptidase family protein [Pseudomonadota bacterium]
MNNRDRPIPKYRENSGQKLSCLIRVSRRPGRNPAFGLLHFAGRTWPCRLGQAGITAFKREGDRATPLGRMMVLGGYIRTDRSRRRFAGNIPLQPIRANDGWCDAPTHPAYNRPVTLPFTASHENMTRTDRLYDLLLVLGWNMEPRARHRGSAIFLHIAPEEADAGTHGCIALQPDHMAQFLSLVEAATKGHAGPLWVAVG